MSSINKQQSCNQYSTGNHIWPNNRLIKKCTNSSNTNSNNDQVKSHISSLTSVEQSRISHFFATSC